MGSVRASATVPDQRPWQPDEIATLSRHHGWFDQELSRFVDALGAVASRDPALS